MLVARRINGAQMHTTHRSGLHAPTPLFDLTFGAVAGAQCIGDRRYARGGGGDNPHFRAQSFSELVQGTAASMR
jgi:hypothetical protein